MLGFNTFTEHSQEIIVSSHNLLCRCDSDQLSAAPSEGTQPFTERNIKITTQERSVFERSGKN